MTLLDELTRLENGFWHATRDRTYYRDHMRADGLVVLAGTVMTKDAADASTQTDQVSDWVDVAIRTPRVVTVADGVAALVYEGSASREGVAYRATCTSVYARDAAGWRLVIHQQSPIQETDPAR